MSAPLKPLSDRIIAVREEAETKTASGLYIPDAAKEKSVLAKVVAIGDEVKEVKVGDLIVYAEYGKSVVELKLDDGEKFLSVREHDVVAVLVKPVSKAAKK